MHAWGLRLRRVRDRLAIAPPAVWPSVTWYDVGTPDAIISQLNALPTCAPVNASMVALRLATHDSGSGWVATPFLCDAFIHDSTPVYPGARRGRDDGHPPPPAQNRTGRIAAYGSYLGCVASKRTFG